MEKPIQQEKHDYKMKRKSLINFSIVPKDDPKQALRIRRFFMATAAYALCGFLGYISYLAGFV
ncbi:MAG: hypothetical protein ABSD50_14370, partial [Smithella sp.]